MAAAIKEDLLRVKDALDLHLRTRQTGVADLQPQVEALSRVADTLGMMGLGVARNVVLQQRDAMHEIVAGNRAADEGALLDIAGALLYVDASLDDQVARLGRADERSDDDPIAGESRKVLDVLVARGDRQLRRRAPGLRRLRRNQLGPRQLAEVPRLLDEVAGALRILELPQPAEYLVGVRRYTEERTARAASACRTASSSTRWPTRWPSLEYYLEALRDHRPNRDGILDIARQSLEALRYWPLPAEAAQGAGAPKPTADIGTIADAEALERRRRRPNRRSPSAPTASDRTSSAEPTQPVADAAPVAAPAPVATGAAGGFEATSDDIDDEIREVFLEEFEEEIGNLGRCCRRGAPHRTTTRSCARSAACSTR